MIREGIAQKEFQDGLKTEIVAFTILGVMNWSYQWFNPSG
ncbi:transcriptional regulator, TetR family [Planococcus sp. PAMC 21323]|nr:transcriptional regulator, TetR family [Planococcus sp. PAMC 21323]